MQPPGLRLRRHAALDVIPDTFDLPAWQERNNALAARIVDGKIISVHAQAYNWHLCISSDPMSYDDDY